MSHEDEMLYNLLSQIKNELREAIGAINTLSETIRAGSFQPATEVKKPKIIIPDPFSIDQDKINCFHKGKEEYKQSFFYGVWCSLAFDQGEDFKSFLKDSAISQRIDNKYDPFYTWRSVRSNGEYVKGWFVATDKKEKLDKIVKYVIDLNGDVFYAFKKGEIFKN